MGLGVEANGVSKSYGGKAALSNVSFKVEPGGLLAVLGPSGSGKTTLLYVLNQLEREDSGDVRFTDPSGAAVDDGTLRRKTTLLLQRSVMLKDSVYGNVAYGLRLRGMGEKEIEPRVRIALKGMGLEGFEKRRASTLSGGEMQRVAFARATVLEPEVIFLDEFTANLDPPNIKMLESALAGFRAKTGCTVVLVSHNPFQAQRLARQCIYLYQGQVMFSGTIETARADRDERMAAFFRGDLS